MTRTFYLLVCRVCAPGQAGQAMIMPFGSEEERGKWAAAHTRGTGHDNWLVTEEYREEQA